jgi:ABC-type phosphate transport system substrate-binding protein
MLASEDEVIAYVSRTKGAIGYVSSAAPTNGVKVLPLR